MLFMKRRPEDVGLIPDGEAQEAARERDESTDSLHRNNGEPPESEPAWTLGEALKTPAFWLLTIASAQGMMAIGGVNLHQFPYLTDRGILPSIAVAAISVFALWSGIGSLLWGFIAERVSIRYSLMASLMASAAGLVLLLSVRNTAMAFGYAVFYGFSMGGIMALTQIVYADYFGRKSLGAIRGFTAPFQMVANAFGPLFAGLMFDIRGSYSLAFLVLAAAYFFGGIWITLARPPRYPHLSVIDKTSANR